MGSLDNIGRKINVLKTAVSKETEKEKVFQSLEMAFFCKKFSLMSLVVL